MKKERKRKNYKGGFYIALCSFALIIAAVGYVNKNDKTEKNNEENIIVSKDDSLFDENFTDSNKNTENKKENKKETVILKEKNTTQNDPPAKKDNIAPVPAAEKPVSNTVIIEDPVLKMPVEGDILCSYSGEELIYNEILCDFRTHNGIDIGCSENSDVHCSFDGVVNEIYDGPLGMSIRIDHQNGYETVYSNLSDDIKLIQGDKVKKGDVIAKSGNTAVADFTQESHIHFELLNNGEYVDPVIYLDN